MPERFGIMALAFWPALAQVWSGQEILGLFLGVFLQGRWTESKRRIERILTWDEAGACALMQLRSRFLRMHQPALARRAFH